MRKRAVLVPRPGMGGQYHRNIHHPKAINYKKWPLFPFNFWIVLNRFGKSGIFSAFSICCNPELLSKKDAGPIGSIPASSLKFDGFKSKYSPPMLPKPRNFPYIHTVITNPDSGIATCPNRRRCCKRCAYFQEK